MKLFGSRHAGAAFLMISSVLSTLFVAVAVLSLSPAQALAAETPRYTLEQQRKTFRAAMKAVKKRRYGSFKVLKKGLTDYPLYGYLEYEYLKRHLGSTPEQEIAAFIEEYEDSPIASYLLSQWLYKLAKANKWEKYNEYYRPTGSVALDCYALQARRKVGETEGLMEAVAELWTAGESRPDQCDPLFYWWRINGGLTQERAWKRINLAMGKRRISLAKYLQRFLTDDKDKRLVDLWVRVHSKPARYLRDPQLAKDNHKTRAILAHGVKRLARLNVLKAHDEWRRISPRYAFDRETRNDVERYVALKAGWKRMPEAVELLSEVHDNGGDEEVKEWLIRSALWNKEWEKVLSVINNLPGTESNEPEWRYWRARALQEIGIARQDSRSVDLATDIFNKISDDRSYYGFLAADQLGQPYNLRSDAIRFEERELEDLIRHPNLVRAYELYKVGMINPARREWRYLLRQLDERQLRLAAVLASRWGWHDRAIITAAKGDHYTDFDVRFPMAYQDLVSKNAEGNSVDPAWVYGVMRQESAFMQDARSSAGAMGLMQLMPGTARMTARMLNTRLRGKYDLLDADKNLKLGSAYLKRMLDKNGGHQILATASYNAGPHRVKRWMPKKEYPADIWVELIPFDETRKYVRRVMAYTTIFDQRLDGEHKTLAERMPVVIPRK